MSLLAKQLTMGQSKPPFIADLQCVVRTDVGMRRAMNQDSSAVVFAEDEQAWASRGHVFLVADGMGAHAAGELASKLAVENLPHLYNHDRDLAAPEALEKAFLDSNAEIHRRGIANLDFRAMGTTASALVLLPQGALIGHVGDSRVYRLRGQQLEQLTFDHSLQWELRSLKVITEGSDSYKAVPKNVITRSLGPNANVVVDLEGPFPLEIGDTFLLCSDGLSGQIEDREIGSLLSHLSPEEAATVLVDLANLRGGPDNITLLIVKIEGPGLVTAGAEDRQRPAARARRADGTNPAAWVVMGVCWLLAAVLWLADQLVPAILFAVVGVFAVGAAVVMRLRNRPPVGKPPTRANHLGKAPYVTTACSAEREFVQTLATILRELREAAIEAGWQVRWNEFERLCGRAESASRTGDDPAAVQAYAQGISFMMHELRNQKNRESGDSVVDP
jgi:protein phosphatase